VTLRHFVALARTLRESAGTIGRAGDDDDDDENDGDDDDDDDDGEEEGRDDDAAAALAREVDDAFSLFTRGARITLADLRRAARELREEAAMDDATLRLMVEEATGEPGGASGVGRDEFEGVMRRAGVFG